MTALAEPPPRTHPDAIRTEALVDATISLLSIQPPDSPVHNVTQYRNGFYIPFQLVCRPPVSPEQLYIYVLPWSRGWSVFTEVDPPGQVVAHWWRYVPTRLKGLQQPIHNPRDTLGPHQVSAERIVTAVLDIIDKLERLNHARLNRFRKERWYWLSSIQAKTDASSNNKES